MFQLMICGYGWSQDGRFSQYYQSPVELNPAFAGATGGGRAGINFRTGGAGDKAKVRKLAAYTDYYFHAIRSSSGLLFISDYYEPENYKSSTLAIPLNFHWSILDHVAIVPALQPSYTLRRSLVQEIFLNGDTLTPIGYEDKNGNFDLAGGLGISVGNLWAGFSIHRLTGGERSLLENMNVSVPARYSFHGGYSFNLPSADKLVRSIMPTVNYVKQGSDRTLDAGVVAWMEPWLAGLVIRNIGGSTGSAMALSAGIRKYDLNLAYSYDLPLSNKSGNVGFHELAVNFSFTSESTKPPKTIREARNPVTFKRDKQPPRFLRRYINFMESRFGE